MPNLVTTARRMGSIVANLSGRRIYLTAVRGFCSALHCRLAKYDRVFRSIDLDLFT